MGRKVVLATCALNQWAMDFDGNLKRILKSKFICTFSRCIMYLLLKCVSVKQLFYLHLLMLTISFQLSWLS